MHNQKRTETCSALTEGRSTVIFCAACLLWNPRHYEDIRTRLATCNTNWLQNEAKAYTSSFAKLLCVEEAVCYIRDFKTSSISAIKHQTHINS